MGMGLEFWKGDKGGKYKMKQEISFAWVNAGRPETEASPLNAPEGPKEGEGRLSLNAKK